VEVLLPHHSGAAFGAGQRRTGLSGHVRFLVPTVRTDAVPAGPGRLRTTPAATTAASSCTRSLAQSHDCHPLPWSLRQRLSVEQGGCSQRSSSPQQVRPAPRRSLLLSGAGVEICLSSHVAPQPGHAMVLPLLRTRASKCIPQPRQRNSYTGIGTSLSPSALEGFPPRLPAHVDILAHASHNSCPIRSSQATRQAPL
jgi:hypothetical protein